MSKNVEIITALQATTSRLEKEAILDKAWKSGNREFFAGAKICYDPFVTFGVAEKMIPGKSVSDGVFPLVNGEFQEFMNLARLLSERKLTGNTAKEKIEKFSSYVTHDDWNLFYRPVLLKDIRCGITDTTINKVLKKQGKETEVFIIPGFECQLALDGKEEVFEGKQILQEKLDGVRILALCEKETNTVTLYTRNGKENKNFSHIKKVFDDLLPNLSESLVFDGEVVGDNFQSLMTQVTRKSNVKSENTRLALFDCLPLSDFKTGISKNTQLQRIEMLEKFTSFSANSSVFVLDRITVDMSTTEGKKEFMNFNNKAIAAGKEGIMIKNPDAPYECKRSKNWMKNKPYIEETLEIVGLEIGTGKNENRLGNFLCKGEVDGKKVEVSVGSGFTEEQRDEYWKNKDNLLGMMIEVRADALTKDRNDDTIWSMRFPRFKGFRGSEPGEKI